MHDNANYVNPVPEYRTPEWKAQIALALDGGAAGIDAAMQWAYDIGNGAGQDYAALEAKARQHPQPTTGMDSVTTYRDWLSW